MSKFSKDWLMASLLQARDVGEPLHITGVHDAISAKIAAKSGFKVLWASGLGIALTHAKPDTNILSHTEITHVVSHMVDAVKADRFGDAPEEFLDSANSVSIIVDGDTGHGEWPIASRFAQDLYKIGAQGLVIEDKKFPKRNSFQENSCDDLEEIGVFCHKLKAVKLACPNLFLAARLEGFITSNPLDDTLNRAKAYIGAGADALVVHSKALDGKEIRSFLDGWDQRAPIIIIPTTYSTDIPKQGVSAAISANQVLRSMTPALEKAYDILLSGGIEAIAKMNNDIASLKKIFDLTGDTELNSRLQNAEKSINNFRTLKL